MAKPKKETLLAGGKIYRHTFRLDEQQQMQFENMMLKAGEPNQFKFVVGRIFGCSFHVVKIDKSAQDYYARLTSVLAQIRAVGVNYNQTVKAIHTNFNDRRAVALLSRLEKSTRELTALEQQVIDLTRELKSKWSHA